MKLSLGVVILAGATACEGGPATVGSFGKTDASAAKDGAADAKVDAKVDANAAGDDDDDDDSGSDAGKKEAGGGGTACTVKESSGSAACDTCEDSKCCDLINACLEDSDCKAIVDCSNNCYADDPKEPDGGKVPDGGGDKCTDACVAQAPSAAQDLYNTQNDCVGTYCEKQCFE